MAKRFTYTTKWDDDWYLSLPPRMKLAWNYICDNCDGVGLLKVSLGLMSYRIGEDVSAEDFRENFKDRVHWISDDTLWIHGFIKAQYKKLSANNKAHANMAAKVVDTINAASSAPIDDKTALALDPLLTLVRLSADPPVTVEGPSGEGHRIQDTGKDSLRGGMGGILAEVWNNHRGDLPKLERLTDKRLRSATAQLKKYPGLDHWVAVLDRWRASEFCMTQWRPGFDDWLSEGKRIATIEGKYDNRTMGKARVSDADVMCGVVADF